MARYVEANPIKLAASPDSPSDRKPKPTSSFLKLSLFLGFADCVGGAASPPARSPRSFDAGAVGLGIVAAMTSDVGLGSGAGSGGVVAKTKTAAALVRPEPIPIIGGGGGRAAPKRARRTREEMELSESYTCVISHVGGGRVRKRVYFGDASGSFEDGGGGWLFEGAQPATPANGGRLSPPGDFLSSCYLCDKKLDGLDIYMYRGEKAFCSAECRCKQMLIDGYGDNCGSEALKSAGEHRGSSCSSSLLSAAGTLVAA